MEEQTDQNEGQGAPVQHEPGTAHEPGKAKDGSKRHAPKKPQTVDLGFKGFSEDNLDKALAHFETQAAQLPPTAKEKLDAVAKQKERIGQLLAKGIKRAQIIEQFKTCGFDLPGQWLAKLIPQEGKGKSKGLAKGIKDIAEHRKASKTIKKK